MSCGELKLPLTLWNAKLIKEKAQEIMIKRKSIDLNLKSIKLRRLQENAKNKVFFYQI